VKINNKCRETIETTIKLNKSKLKTGYGMKISDIKTNKNTNKMNKTLNSSRHIKMYNGIKLIV
jgi:hypothetical protein